eukprot:TRINITY_DN5933_c0_g1_i1.p1 TRINITY_DN5933_c0_g1~~TRINITY_DN5933_c0_g1_i1.p1  ORF type:complete len:397 (-),score=93.22 TRINITY_DN5933_c0_g1_i1:600-1790(-)
MGGDSSMSSFYAAPEDVLSAAEAYKFMTPAFGHDVVYDCPDKKFQEQRKFLGKNLTVNAFKKMVGIISDEASSYLDEVWKEKGSLDFYHDVGEMIMRTSTHALQGSQIRALVHKGYAKYMEDIDGALSILSFFYPNLPMPSFRKRDLARKNIGEMIKTVLKFRRDNADQEQNDFLELLSSSTYSDGTQITDEQIAGLCVALMLAGQHTSNITSTWLGIFILSHPEVLASMKEEQERVWPEGEELTYDKLNKMNYMHLCIKETLRLRPPIILVWRKALQNFSHEGFTIPAGTLVCVSPAVTGRQESLGWTNPMEFDPLRFERKEDKVATNSYIAFSRGKHSCIGEKFAYLQIKTIWSIIFRKYNVTLQGTHKNYPVDPASLLAGPVPPVTIHYEKRT